MKQKCFILESQIAFCRIQWLLTVSSLVSLPFLNPACISGSFWYKYYWSLAWLILSITLLICERSTAFSDMAFLWDWNESWPFPVLWPLLSFPCLLTYWVHTGTASSFRIGLCPSPVTLIPGLGPQYEYLQKLPIHMCIKRKFALPTISEFPAAATFSP